MSFPRIYYTSARGQCAVILLAALHEMYTKDALCTVTRQEAISFISRKKWFDLKGDDLEPYPSQRYSTNEPRWQTLIAWARKDTVLSDLVSYEARNSWGLTRRGRTVFEAFHERCKTGTAPVGDCFLWSGKFKTLLNPNYIPSAQDALRPLFFYRDSLPDFMDFFGLLS